MKTALYARVSTQRQAQTQNIKRQLERLQAYCETQQWTLSPENVFRDDGYSGATLKQPRLDRLHEGGHRTTQSDPDHRSRSTGP